MSLDFSDIISNLENHPDFEEIPVSPEEFVYGEEFLDFTDGGTRDIHLSENQMNILKAGTQIFRHDTLMEMYGPERGRQRWSETKQEIVMVLGKGNQCMTQRVWSPDHGYVPAADLMKGEWIAQSRGTTHYATPFYEEGEDDILRVTTRKGYSVDIGLNHALPGWKKVEGQMKVTNCKPNSRRDITTAELRVGDYIELKVGWSPPTTEAEYDVSLDEARLIGYMVGDGTWVRVSDADSILRGQAQFTNSTPEVQEDFLKICDSMGFDYSIGESGAGCWQVTLKSKFTHWCLRHGLAHRYNETKGWNFDWMRMSDRAVREFVRGVWATDGWFSITSPSGRRKSDTVVAGVEMVSESCMEGLHIMLLRVGFTSTLTRNHRPVRGDGKHRATHRVQMSRTLDVKRFYEWMGGVPGKSIDWGALSPPSDLKWNEHIDSISSIEPLGRKPSVGVMVQIEHNYVAGGIINCNSGKDFLSTIICAYIVYQLICLKDPSRYFNKPAGNTFDIINVAINAQQANNVFFKNFVSLIKNAPWFRGKFYDKASQVDFDKEIRVYSGHSEREAFEGYNLFACVLDEIDGFADPGPTATESAKSADALYEMYKNSVISRFPQAGKLIMLSFPRTKSGFIMRKYDEFVVEKEIIHRQQTIKLDPDRPDGLEDNELVIEWEEDHIGMYIMPGIYALKRPTWDVNPTKSIQDFAAAFIANYPVALGKFACMPPESLEGLFRDRERVESAFSSSNGVDNGTGNFADWFRQEGESRYFVHVDLAKKHDRCVVAVAHVEGWERKFIAGTMSEPVPRIVVDAIRYWTPTKEKNVDFGEVREYIVSLRQRGLNVRLVTFDQWQSSDMIEYLKSIGIRSEKLGVSISEYTDLVTVVQDSRLRGPNIPLLHKELLELRLLPSGKVDHPRSGSNDIADAVAGAVYNAIAHTPRPQHDANVEIVTASEMRLAGHRPEDEEEKPKAPSGVIMPPGLREFIEEGSWVDDMRLI